MKVYEDNIALLQTEATKLAVSDRRLSTARLLTILAAGFLFYKYLQTEEFLFLLSGLLTTITFFMLVNKHRSVRWMHELVKAKIQINEDEHSFLTKGDLNFDNGDEFVQHDHPYSYDLDFFGDRSLFQTLNRTGTVTGKRKLADILQSIKSPEHIIESQEAIREMAPQVDWRQHLLALARLNPDTNESYSDLLKWASKQKTKLSGLLNIFSFLSPVLMLVGLGLYFLYSNELAGRFCLLLGLINLGVVASQISTIKGELITSTKIEHLLKQYSFLLKEIEKHSFASSELQLLQTRLRSTQRKASTSIHELSLLFGRLEHVQNIFAGPILNGLFTYHLHVLRSLAKWRRLYATHIEDWLDTIGEFEQLNSLANFSHNNPDFVFPNINAAQHIQFEDLGHPLIAKENSVTNSIDFDNQKFFILTGSNMSGKSTFLRTLGVNMVLAGIGAPVYATKANVHPMPVFVSMRLSDSLSDSESYFYAEVKRLKSIMDHLDQEQSFVLLDEILRGTNSDDKRNGTMEVIRKMVEKQAFGGIATHDLEVCNVTNEHPKILSNKRFEVEIVDDELVFDYKLREGICENKSASFIMKKMGVI